jgi:hypothetical protein
VTDDEADALELLLESVRETLEEVSDQTEVLMAERFADTPRLRQFNERVGEEIEAMMFEIREFFHRQTVRKTLEISRRRKDVERGL